MTPEFGQAVRRLVAGEPADSASQIAARAAHEIERFAKQVTKLVGVTGSRLLLRRSVILASSKFPWLALALAADNTVTAVRTAMEQQDVETILDAFAGVLSQLVGILDRLIGDGLVQRQLDAVWPNIFTYSAKDTE